jgi:hypothetical protein
MVSPKTKVDSHKDTSQVALYEDPNTIRFAKDSSQLVIFSFQYCDCTYPCQAERVEPIVSSLTCSARLNHF